MPLDASSTIVLTSSGAIAEATDASISTPDSTPHVVLATGEVDSEDSTAAPSVPDTMKIIAELDVPAAIAPATTSRMLAPAATPQDTMEMAVPAILPLAMEVTAAATVPAISPPEPLAMEVTTAAIPIAMAAPSTTKDAQATALALPAEATTSPQDS
jgi:hypothetical protein